MGYILGKYRKLTICHPFQNTVIVMGVEVSKLVELGFLSLGRGMDRSQIQNSLIVGGLNCLFAQQILHHFTKQKIILIFQTV